MAKTASYFLPAGHWFLSLYNDDGDANEVSFVARVAPELTRNCPKGCSGRGECVLGKCQCHAGFDGPDCGQSKCIDRYCAVQIYVVKGLNSRNLCPWLFGKQSK